MTDAQDPEPGERPFLATALKYDGSGAPRLVAKGRGAVAEAIVATARENGVEIEEDPLLAEALATVELDTEIPIALYAAVAEVIGALLAVRRRAG